MKPLMASAIMAISIISQILPAQAQQRPTSPFPIPGVGSYNGTILGPGNVPLYPPAGEIDAKIAPQTQKSSSVTKKTMELKVPTATYQGRNFIFEGGQTFEVKADGSKVPYKAPRFR